MTMNRFCGKCGTALGENAGFCGSCGANMQPGSVPLQHPTIQPAFQPVTPAAVAPAVPATKASSPWLKVIVAVLIVIFVIGAAAVGGVIYVAHKVSQKAHEYSRKVLGETSGTTQESAADKPMKPVPVADNNLAIAGDPCRLLSKEDVGRAIGVPIVETSPADGGCSYLAKGTAPDMAAKHAAATIGAKGADKKTQGIFEQFASSVFNNMPKNGTTDTESAGGNVVVFTFGIDNNSAREQMHLNAKVLGDLGSETQQPLEGIGDEAFAEADSMIMVRKGDKLIRIMYMSCPCSTDAVKPLARQLAANL
jgi:hypothetical protein